MGWFDVDKAGLAAILERRGKFFALAELIANSWDSNATEVHVSLFPVEGKPFATLEVRDNGEGFSDLKESFTMFSRSRRGGDFLKRGRFNLGEKLVLAVCRWAHIDTITGGIEFKEDGTTRATLTPLWQCRDGQQSQPEQGYEWTNAMLQMLLEENGVNLP